MIIHRSHSSHYYTLKNWDVFYEYSYTRENSSPWASGLQYASATVALALLYCTAHGKKKIEKKEKEDVRVGGTSFFFTFF